MDHGHDMEMPMPPDPTYDNSTDMMKGMVMHMSFFWGKDVTVLFAGWPDDSVGMYILALIFVFFLAFAVEALSYSPSPAARTGASHVVTSLVFTVIYAARMALAYMVMLSVMSFNLGIFIVAVAGHAAGYFLVKLRKKDSSTDQDPKP